MSVRTLIYIFFAFFAFTAVASAGANSGELSYCDSRKMCATLFNNLPGLERIFSGKKSNGYSVKRIVRNTDAKAQRLRGDYMMYSSYIVIPRDEVDHYRDIKTFLTDIHKQDIKLLKNFLGKGAAYFVGRDFTDKLHAFRVHDSKILEQYLWKFHTLGFRATEYKYPRNDFELFENTIISEGAGKLRIAIPDKRLLLEWTLDRGIVVYMRKKRSNKYLYQKAGIKNAEIVRRD